VLGNFHDIQIPEHERDYLLAILAEHVFEGPWLKILVSVDAAIVLSGAVLTSFVGVTGLIRRMTLDRCLPQFLLRTNRRGTSHWIILTFLILCISIVLATGGELLSLAGVYTLSFLSVMCLFAMGNMLLKVRRGRLRRDYYASWPIVIAAFFATIIGIVGNIAMKPRNFLFFMYYFVPTVLTVIVMLKREDLLKIPLYGLNEAVKKINLWNQKIGDAIRGKIDEINAQAVVFFTRGDSAENLNKVMLYVMENETTNRVIIIHVYDEEKNIPENLKKDVDYLDKIYPEIKMDLVLRQGTFGPKLVDTLSRELQVPENYMFIGHPGHDFPHNIADLGGVRLII
ncbi:APC family permease, partial [bacterium]|nr:APC family permease [bacterium]